MKQEDYNQKYGMGSIFDIFTNTGIINPNSLITISGTVVNEVGDPVPNASVVISGTATGTMADFDGNFTLHNVPSNAIIDFSYAATITKIPAKNASGTVQIQTTITGDEIVLTGPGAKPNYWKYAGWGILAAVVVYAMTRKSKPTPRLAAPRKRKSSKNTHVKATL